MPTLNSRLRKPVLKMFRLDSPMVAANNFVAQTFIQVQEVDTTLFIAGFRLVNFTHTLTGTRYTNSIANALHPKLPQV